MRSFAIGLLGLLFVGCKANGEDAGGSFGGESPNAEGSGGTAESPSSGGTSSNGGSTLSGLPGAGGSSVVDCSSGTSDDADNDGFTVEEGDCNDCDANVNPGSIEVIAEDPEAVPADEDCDGTTDVIPASCDDGLAMDGFDANDAAKALGLCKTATLSDKNWGVISANYVRANGGTASESNQVGILEGFGDNVTNQEGSRLLALSSGRARIPGQSGACDDHTCEGYGEGYAPTGFPQDVAGCPGSTDINDDVALELTLRAPMNATGFSFQFSFYSFEYAEWVCDEYNDQFIALVDPPPEGSISGNISFDTQGNPVSVNIALFNVCKAGSGAPCVNGTAELEGTGFDVPGVYDDEPNGATGWLQSTSPIQGGQEFTIRFAIWDTGDQNYDSTVIIDNFQWIANGGTVSVSTDIPE